VLFRVSMAILGRHRETLVAQPDTIGVMRFLKSSTKLLFDADGLLQVAYQPACPSLCPIRPPQQRTAGLLLWARRVQEMLIDCYTWPQHGAQQQMRAVPRLQLT